MDFIDILTIIIVAIIIIVIIVINMHNALDSKLSDISVTIPPISIPDPNITIKIQKSCNSDDYTILRDKPVERTTMAISPIVSNNTEHFDMSINGIVSKISQPIPIVKHESEKPYVITKNNEHYRYKQNEPSQLTTIPDLKPKTTPQYEKCKNPPMTRYGEVPSAPATIEHNNDLNDDDWDPTIYYKNNIQHIKTTFEDPLTRGANVATYDNLGTLDDIGRIRLNNDDKYIKPIGYVFKESSAYER